MSQPKIRVLIVDDSILIRRVLKQILYATDDIEVVGSANDPIIAREKIKQLNPDVITLDVEMPKMNGIQFLNNLMRLRPMPVIMVSTLTEAGAPVTLEALELGALDYLAKPQLEDKRQLNQFSRDLTDKIRMASRAKVRPLKEHHKVRYQQAITSPGDFSRWILIGASTGGTEALKELLLRVPQQCPPILITQHIPAVFSASFANRLNNAIGPEVVEAKEGMEIRPGRIIIAEGDHHLTFARKGNQVVCALPSTPPVNRHRPSVEVMFDAISSVRRASDVVAVMLTGMGADGAEGMRRLKQAGATTLAQDEASSVVWGMPGAAVALGAVDQVLPLENLTSVMLNLAAGKKTAKAS